MKKKMKQLSKNGKRNDCFNKKKKSNQNQYQMPVQYATKVLIIISKHQCCVSGDSKNLIFFQNQRHLLNSFKVVFSGTCMVIK